MIAILPSDLGLSWSLGIGYASVISQKWSDVFFFLLLGCARGLGFVFSFWCGAQSFFCMFSLFFFFYLVCSWGFFVFFFFFFFFCVKYGK